MGAQSGAGIIPRRALGRHGGTWLEAAWPPNANDPKIVWGGAVRRLPASRNRKSARIRGPPAARGRRIDAEPVPHESSSHPRSHSPRTGCCRPPVGDEHAVRRDMAIPAARDDPSPHPLRRCRGNGGRDLRPPSFTHRRQALSGERPWRRGGLRLQRRRQARHLLHQRRRDADARQARRRLRQQALSQRRRHEVHRRDRGGRRERHRIRHGCGGRRLRQRRPRRSLRRRRRAQPAAAQPRRRQLRGRHRAGAHRQRRMVSGCRLVRLRQRRPARSPGRQLRALVGAGRPLLRRPGERRAHLLPSPVFRRPAQSSLPQSRRRHVRGRVGSRPASRSTSARA